MILTSIDDDYQSLIQPIEGCLIHSIARILPNPADAEEALQEALETILKQFSKIRIHPNPQALILRIGMNSAYDLLRRRGRRQRMETVSLQSDIEDAQPSMLDRLARQELRQEIYQAIRCLSRKQAQSILLRFIQELSFPEIAQALGCSEATARTHVKRGCAHLRKFLAPYQTQTTQEVQL